jgi:hypothetical protein
VVKLGSIAESMETRAGLLAVTGNRSLATAGDALNELITELREAEAELRSDDA